MALVQAQLHLGNSPSVVPAWQNKGRGRWTGRTIEASEPAALCPTYRSCHVCFPVSQLFP